MAASLNVHGETGGTLQKKENKKGQEPPGALSLQRVLLLHRGWPTGSYSEKVKAMGVEEAG